MPIDALWKVKGELQIRTAETKPVFAAVRTNDDLHTSELWLRPNRSGGGRASFYPEMNLSSFPICKDVNPGESKLVTLSHGQEVTLTGK